MSFLSIVSGTDTMFRYQEQYTEIQITWRTRNSDVLHKILVCRATRKTAKKMLKGTIRLHGDVKVISCLTAWNESLKHQPSL